MRARQITLHARTELKLKRLKREAETDGAYRVAKRIHAVLLNAESHTSGEIARILDAPLSRVSQWLRGYDVSGFKSLLEGHRSGRPPGLSKQQLTQLSDILDNGPVAYGYLSGVWTAPMVARMIEEEFERTYHPHHVCKILEKLDFSVQRPKRLLARADPDQQDRWHRYTYPDLKKTPGTKKQRSSLKTKPVSGKTQHFTKPGRASAINR